ncbi:MAG TPA: aminopeptidase [Janthinobacterium sp.]|nr:aminopeptidase [Janthinobacterium sp.]
MSNTFSVFAASALAASLTLAFPAHAAHVAHAMGASKVQEGALRTHLEFLSSDALEGRGTGQRGGDLTVAYLESQALGAGLKPAAGAGFRQSVKIVGVKVLPDQSNIHLEADGKTLPIAFGRDWVWAPGDGQASRKIDTELVFVGYGISAPEEGWDDYKGANCAGKVLVMLVNDPRPTAAEPARFGGKAMTYYGRWSYKFEEAKRRGAAGVLLIHTDASATYAWGVVQNGWGLAERFQPADGNVGSGVQGWLTEAAARTLFTAGGQNLDKLRAAAERKDFLPIMLTAKLKGEMKSAVRKVEQFNIAGLVPGRDPKLKDEVVIYSAHWDHLGKLSATGEIFNGAVDNASGSAALLAMAKAAARKPARRSQMFLWTAAEEQGLLGSAAYAASPLWPLNKTAADLNLDTLNSVGATRDIGVDGSQRSDLGKTAEKVARSMGLHIDRADPDLRGDYFRGDHFNFAKAGVPAFSIDSGHEFVRNQAASMAKVEAYGKRYHQSSDKYDAAWDLGGMTQQAQFTLNLGQAIANAPKMPAWKAGDALGRVRSAPTSAARP